MTLYSFAQIAALWDYCGGPPDWRWLMAGIALAESSGNDQVVNDDPATFDYSVGLFQINYFGSLYSERAAKYGTPAQLLAEVGRQYAAAIDLCGNGAGIYSAWGTDVVGSAWNRAGRPYGPDAATVQSWASGVGPIGPQGPIAEPMTPMPGQAEVHNAWTDFQTWAAGGYKGRVDGATKLSNFLRSL